MATRSVIGMVEDNGSIRAVYCHWDGYLAYNGAILHKHYRTREQVADLLDHGNISSLGTVVGTEHEFDERPEGETTFYGRDRGEQDQEARVFSSEGEFFEWALDCYADYVYVMDEHAAWKVLWYSRLVESDRSIANAYDLGLELSERAKAA